MKKIRLVLFILTLSLAGCVSTPERTISPPGKYILKHEITWSAQLAIGKESYRFPAGVYLATMSDDEGLYLMAPNGVFDISQWGMAPNTVEGGVFLPFDQSKGINMFIRDQGAATVAGGTGIFVPGNGRYKRFGRWGPAELIQEFKKE